MWTEGLLLLLLIATAGGAAGWLAGSRRSVKREPQREDMSSSSLITETERRMLELVAKGAPLSEVLNTLTEAVERISPESHCTIMLLDEEHRRRLLMASGPSLPPAYLQATNGLEIGPEVGACGSAAYRNQTVVIEDIATDPRFEGARDFVLSHGLRSVWSQPVRDSTGAVLGTFAIYRRQVSSPRPQELRLVRVAGQLAGNAIERIRAEKQLLDAVRRLSLAERVARFGIWEADFQKNIVTLSEGLAALLERPPSRFQLTPFEFEAMVHPDDRHDLWSSADGRKVLAGTQQAEFRLVLPSGTVRWMRSQWAFEPGSQSPTRATGAMIDVTKEKDMLVEAEQERAAAEASARVARQAERLEQDRKMILELVANDQPLEQVAATMATTVASHLPGSLCAIRIEVPDDAKIALYPDFPPALAEACEGVELASIKDTLTAAPIERLSDSADWPRRVRRVGKDPHPLYRAVPVVRNSQRVGIILSLLREESCDFQSQHKLLESWGRFASLAVERRSLYKQLSFRAQYDSLTNLLNRASLYERLAGLIRGSSAGNAVAIIYLDLDSFKEINDALGHAAGDVVLKHVARQIVASVRRTDAVARIGGDEFVIVLPGVSDRSQVVQVANTIAQAIAVPVEVEDRLLATGASLGISLYPSDGEDTDTLLKVADESMYKVKLTHRSRRASEALAHGSADRAAGNRAVSEGIPSGDGLAQGSSGLERSPIAI
jgi:diguanylate cyclase (GGDEF)-like protein